MSENNSNLEMRKIKSLNCLYEISKDARVIRNSKSKKFIKQQKHPDGKHTFVVKIKGVKREVQTDLVMEECWRTPKYKIILHGEDGDFVFNSLVYATLHITNKRNANYKTVRSRLRNRRKHIFGYDVEYVRIAETRHGDSTE